MNKEMKTMWVSLETKNTLDELKTIPEEPYDKVVRRLLDFFKEHEKKEATQ